MDRWEGHGWELNSVKMEFCVVSVCGLSHHRVQQSTVVSHKKWGGAVE